VRAPTSDAPNCLICGRLVENHQRCPDCRILIGPGHYERAADPAGRCRTCRRLAEHLRRAGTEPSPVL
jgi:hypothetical protein